MQFPDNDPELSGLLDHSRGLTTQMKDHQDEITDLGDKRRDIWLALAKRGVTQPMIAKRCDVALHTVYMNLRRARRATDGG